MAQAYNKRPLFLTESAWPVWVQPIQAARRVTCPSVPNQLTRNRKQPIDPLSIHFILQSKHVPNTFVDNIQIFKPVAGYSIRTRLIQPITRSASSSPCSCHTSVHMRQFCCIYLCEDYLNIYAQSASHPLAAACPNTFEARPHHEAPNNTQQELPATADVLRLGDSPATQCPEPCPPSL